MTDRWQKQLQKELRQAGADASELDLLVSLATSLQSEKHIKNSALKRSWEPIIWMSAVGSLGIIVTIAFFSQSVLPNNLLYPVQTLSDQIIISVHPSYRQTLMMRRAEQVRRLVIAHADAEVVLTTLADYNMQVAAYKPMPHTSYSAFEYCETSLKQAAAIAPPRIHQAILTSLTAAENT